LDQKIVDFSIVGIDPENVNSKWLRLERNYEIKRREMLRLVYELYPTFEIMVRNNLASMISVRGQAGANGRFPTENDVDILLFATSIDSYGKIRSHLTNDSKMFKRVTWVEQEYDKCSHCSPVYILRENVDEKYDLDVWSVVLEKEEWKLRFLNKNKAVVMDKNSIPLLDDMKIIIRGI
jgi:hypothetical protein